MVPVESTICLSIFLLRIIVSPEANSSIGCLFAGVIVFDSIIGCSATCDFCSSLLKSIVLYIENVIAIAAAAIPIRLISGFNERLLFALISLVLF